jgi:hypothetical protein
VTKDRDTNAWLKDGVRDRIHLIEKPGIRHWVENYVTNMDLAGDFSGFMIDRIDVELRGPDALTLLPEGSTVNDVALVRHVLFGYPL